MAGRTTATTGRPSAATAARASTPASDGAARWSADSAPSSAASSAPPDGASSSAWSRGRSPRDSAARRIRRLWSGPKTPRSQKTSANRADPLGGDSRELVLDDLAGVGLDRVRVVAVLGRDGVGAEPRREDLDRPLLAQPVGDLEEPELGPDVKTVAGLRLDGRDAVTEHLVEPAPTVSQQLLRRSRPGGRHRGEDAAPGLEDLEVPGAPLTKSELALA